MILFPAIDIKDGACVRLYQGDYSTAHKVAEDPQQTAVAFAQAGAKWLHMVDLDGAKAKRPINTPVFLQAAKNTGLKVQVGGGIRTLQDIEQYLSQGISRVILGSVALYDAELVRTVADRYGERIAVGIDARNGMVAAEGWTQTSKMHYIDLAKQMEQVGVKYIIFTDIEKDGTLAGPNLEQLDLLNQAVSCHIIASGGVANLQNIKDLCGMSLYGAICGKSLYSGSLDLAEAIAVAERETSDECTVR